MILFVHPLFASLIFFLLFVIVFFPYCLVLFYYFFSFSFSDLLPFSPAFLFFWGYFFFFFVFTFLTHIFKFASMDIQTRSVSCSSLSDLAFFIFVGCILIYNLNSFSFSSYKWFFLLSTLFLLNNYFQDFYASLFFSLFLFISSFINMITYRIIIF